MRPGANGMHTPWVTMMMFAPSGNRPLSISRTMWSSNIVIRSYTSAPLSPARSSGAGPSAPRTTASDRKQVEGSREL